MIYLVPSPPDDEVIDDLYELVDGRPTVWAATEVFVESSRMTHLAPFFETTDMAQICSRQSMFIFYASFLRPLASRSQ